MYCVPVLTWCSLVQVFLVIVLQTCSVGQIVILLSFSRLYANQLRQSSFLTVGLIICIFWVWCTDEQNVRLNCQS